MDGSGSVLDPIRIMKGLFLFQHQNSHGEKADFAHPPYVFEPYAYGPFTSSLYTDLDALAAEGYVTRIPLADRNYVLWRLTPDGSARVESVVADGEISPGAMRRLRAAKQIVMTNRFKSLLRYVYARFPEYARESVAKL
jgi:hypothetical protein